MKIFTHYCIIWPSYEYEDQKKNSGNYYSYMYAHWSTCSSTIRNIQIIFSEITKVHINNAVFFLATFGKKVETRFLRAPIRNIISFIFGGFINGVMLIMVGLLFCITIVGIPVGKIMFGGAKLTIAPFHAVVTKKII